MQVAATHEASPQPVSFEIELERRDTCPAPPVKQRLEEHQRNPLTLQMIKDKLDRANERKAQVIASQVDQMRDCIDRVGLTKERKSSQERAQGRRISEVLGQKLDTAEAKRQLQLKHIQEKAREQNVKVMLVRERRNSKERAEEQRVQETIEKKLQSAEERQAQMLNSIQEKAKTHNQKAFERAQTRPIKEQEALDNKKTQIEEKLTRAATKRVDPAEKARAYNAKVQEKLSSMASDQQETAESRKARIEAKLSGAASRREELIVQVKATAAQSAAPRAAASQSPTKIQGTAAEEQ